MKLLLLILEELFERSICRFCLSSRVTINCNGDEEESERAHRRDQTREILDWRGTKSRVGGYSPGCQESLRRALRQGRAFPHGAHSGIFFSFHFGSLLVNGSDHVLPFEEAEPLRWSLRWVRT